MLVSVSIFFGIIIVLIFLYFWQFYFRPAKTNEIYSLSTITNEVSSEEIDDTNNVMSCKEIHDDLSTTNQEITINKAELVPFAVKLSRNMFLQKKFLVGFEKFNSGGQPYTQNGVEYNLGGRGPFYVGKILSFSSGNNIDIIPTIYIPDQLTDDVTLTDSKITGAIYGENLFLYVVQNCGMCDGGGSQTLIQMTPTQKKFHMIDIPSKYSPVNTMSCGGEGSDCTQTNNNENTLDVLIGQKDDSLLFSLFKNTKTLVAYNISNGTWNMVPTTTVTEASILDQQKKTVASLLETNTCLSYKTPLGDLVITPHISTTQGDRDFETFDVFLDIL